MFAASTEAVPYRQTIYRYTKRGFFKINNIMKYNCCFSTYLFYCLKYSIET